jgi:hypothetical protein
VRTDLGEEKGCSSMLGVSARHIAELGVLIGGGGAAVMAWAAFWFLRGEQDAHARRRERVTLLVGALLLGLGFAVQLFGLATAPVQPTTPSPSPSVGFSP